MGAETAPRADTASPARRWLRRRWEPGQRWRTAIIALLLVGAASYGYQRWYESAATAYFKRMCETEAGEWVYRVVEDVEGVFQMRLRDPRDLVSRLREGDVPEDLWGHSYMEALTPHLLFVGSPGKYRYFENPYPDSSRGAEDSAEFRRYTAENPDEFQSVTSLASRYGYNWREISTKKDRFFGVSRGELVVLELGTAETLGKAVGFSSPWGPKCPSRADERYVFQFVSAVLVPTN